jgi:hypothetical protein
VASNFYRIFPKRMAKMGVASDFYGLFTRTGIVASDTAQKIGLFLCLDAAVMSNTENHCPCK